MSRPAGIPVLLTITGTQTDRDGNRQENTSVREAVCTRDGDGYLFRYREEGDEASLFLSRGAAWMRREGQAGLRMEFDPEKDRAQCGCRTPFGTIPMSIRTQKISLLDGARSLRRESSPVPQGQEEASFRREKKALLRARIKYTLDMEGGYIQDCTVTVLAETTEE